MGPGRYYTGLQQSVYLFPSSFQNVEFGANATGAGTATPIPVRVRDGQQITLEISFQYTLSVEFLYQLYSDYKHLFVDFYIKASRSRLRDIAARHTSQEFFYNRTGIEHEMRQALAKVLSSRYAVLQGFQVRRIVLPARVETQLQAINLKKHEAARAREAVTLFTIRSETTRQIDQLRASKRALELSLRQETENLRLSILRNDTAQRQATAQAVAQLRSATARFLTVYRAHTENMRLRVAQNETLIRDSTTREVAAIQAESHQYLSLFRQRTQNAVLAINRNLTIIQEETAAAVAAVQSQTDLLLEQGQQHIRSLDAAAAATSSAISLAAQARSRTLSGGAVASGLRATTQQLSFSPSNLLHMEWVAALAQHSRSRKFVQLRTPQLFHMGTANATLLSTPHSSP